MERRSSEDEESHQNGVGSDFGAGLVKERGRRMAGRTPGQTAAPSPDEIPGERRLSVDLIRVSTRVSASRGRRRRRAGLSRRDAVFGSSRFVSYVQVGCLSPKSFSAFPVQKDIERWANPSHRGPISHRPKA